MAWGDKVSARTVLWWMVFLGFAVNYMVRLNINIAIVSMVIARYAESNKDIHVSECFNASQIIPHNETGSNQTDLPLSTLTSELSIRFDWDEYQQGLVLGAFYWLHWVCQILGGIWAQRYGTKIVFGFSNLIMCLLGFLIPMSATIDYRALIFIRIIQGLVGGVCWPSMHHMAASWIPPNERSNFVTAYLGSSVGAALTYPMCGLLIGWFDWPAVFHTTGLLGILWFAAWWFLIFDTPLQHPRIAKVELRHIETSLGYSGSKRKPPTPWKKIMLSGPLWMNILAQWGNIWGLFTLLTQAPTYFKYIHGWNIRMTGLLSGMPHLCRVAFAYAMSMIGDHMLKQDKMSRTGVRKMATAVCSIGQGLFVLGLAFSGCNYMSAIICLTAATAVSGAVSTGPLASPLDLSPNFASIMLGITNMITVMPGFISPIIVGLLTYQNQTVGQWKLVFIIASTMMTSVGVLYICFSSSELQEWDQAEPLAKEMQVLSSKGVEDKQLQPLVIDRTQSATKDDEKTYPKK